MSEKGSRKDITYFLSEFILYLKFYLFVQDIIHHNDIKSLHQDIRKLHIEKRLHSFGLRHSCWGRRLLIGKVEVIGRPMRHQTRERLRPLNWGWRIWPLGCNLDVTAYIRWFGCSYHHKWNILPDQSTTNGFPRIIRNLSSLPLVEIRKI